ncbi:MAG: NADH-quinone oxidoreductase subunit C [Spirochaetes bacterium]|nr:MAG: NADH-quinone oxidoreductase subunit C [Spirochaetota bacterium]
MMEDLESSPVLTRVHDALAARYPESLSEWTFEKGELTAIVRSDALVEVLVCLKGELGFIALNDMIGLDNMNIGDGRKRFSVLYQLYRFPAADRIRLRVDIGEGETLPSIYFLYRSSDWAEREIYDMFGIVFKGHPDLRRIYMPEEFDGHPLRKDFPLEGRNP